MTNDQFSSLFTRYLHYEATLEAHDQFSSLFTRYLHYEDTLEDVRSQILPLGLAHKPTDNTEHADNCLLSEKQIKELNSPSIISWVLK